MEVQCSPTVKLDEGTFVQWKQHVRLIVEGYELIGFLDGMVPAPPRFVQFLKGSLVLNSDASAFIQQDRLLTSWLLSIINSSLLSSFTEARTMCDVWNTATCLFAAVTGTKLSQLRHDLYSMKKGSLSVTERYKDEDIYKI
ncbi:hypothetical protein V6Z12_D04G131900 [Gossypium hirsutum]